MADRVETALDDDFHPAALPLRAEIVENLRAIASGPYDKADDEYITFVRFVCYAARC